MRKVLNNANPPNPKLVRVLHIILSLIMRGLQERIPRIKCDGTVIVFVIQAYSRNCSSHHHSMLLCFEKNFAANIQLFQDL
jgi:hypothetical protein